MVDVNVEQQIRVPQLTIRVDRTTAARYGIKAGDLMQNIQMYLNGETVSSVQEGRRSFDLYVRLEHSARNSVETIRDMLVDAPGLDSTHNVKVPLREVASVSLQDEPYSISRENDRRLIIVSFNTQGGDLSGIIRDIQAKIGEQISLPPGYSIEFGGQFESQQQANRTLLVFGTLALFGALILLYKAFGTFREALLVLINLPLAMIGGVMALYLAGADMSVAAVIGFITLFGIATRNGIILISHYNQLRKEGKTPGGSGRVGYARSAGAGADDRGHRLAGTDPDTVGIARGQGAGASAGAGGAGRPADLHLPEYDCHPLCLQPHGAMARTPDVQRLGQ